MKILENIRNYAKLENMSLNDAEQQDVARQKVEFDAELHNNHLI